jgi:hypothetical protein
MHAHAQFAQQAIDGVFVLELLVKVRVRVCIIVWCNAISPTAQHRQHWKNLIFATDLSLRMRTYISEYAFNSCR